MSPEILEYSASDLGNTGIAVREAYFGFQEHIVPPGAEKKMLDDVIDILGRCATGSGMEPVTGLVVGQVQSGKTMSYEGLICLAHDSGFPLVVVVSGISTPLLAQGVGRLREDLTKASERAWHFLENPKMSDASSSSILESVVQDWSDPDIPLSRRRTVVISVLKHYGHLANLTELLGTADWSHWPVLIIDDEADQASLNNLVQRSRVSSTYRTLVGLRAVFPTFSYVQYTATPQAPLLISIADALSPKFVHVLEPGEGYVGGEILFSGPSPLVHTISPTDVAFVNSGALDQPPSLTDALRVFFLGLAAALFDPKFDESRSMLIHPSQGTDPHSRYATWADSTRRVWMEIVRDRESHPDDFRDLMEEFELARADLLQTIPDLPSLIELASSLKLALSRTHVIKMNAKKGKTPSVPWDDFSGFILVGGQALDRGFTVKGLTVTYMPRGSGVGNADTIQQRARFFGYKADYLAYCRIYLESDLRTAFENYVEHEIDMRKRLKSIEANGTPLSDWRRTFVLDPSLKPTRQTVQKAGFLQDQFSDDWYWDNTPNLESLAISSRQSRVADFLAGKTRQSFEGHVDRTPAQRHEVIKSVLLRDVIEFLATLPVIEESNSLKATGLLVQLEHALEAHPEELADVYVMRPSELATRGLRANGSITELFQGESTATKKGKRGEIYPGDRAIRTAERVTIQLHSINLEEELAIVAIAVPFVATWVPSRLATGWFVQDS